MANSESMQDQLQGGLTSPATMEALLSTVTPEIYASLKEAVALHRWPDGSRLSPEQVENAMQLVILYEHKHLPPEQHTGQKLTSSCGSSADTAEPITLKTDLAGSGGGSGNSAS